MLALLLSAAVALLPHHASTHATRASPRSASPFPVHGVFFEHGKVTAVFTLGSPLGWRTDRGLKMGDVISQVYDYYNTSITTKCIGYDAISYRTGSTTTSFYSSSGYVYGFAL